MLNMGHGPACCVGGIRGYGNLNSRVVVVGIAPGHDEVQTGRPFTGASGLLFNAILEAVGVARDDLYCTNLICTWHDEPTPEEIATCTPRLVKEIMSLNPKLIIPLGAIPCEFFLHRKVGSVRGSVIWDPDWNSYIMPAYHPAGILHASNDKPGVATELGDDLYRDLRKIPWILSDAVPARGWAEPTYEVVSTAHEAQQALDSLQPGIPITLDIETSNDLPDTISVFTDELLCFGVSQTGDHAIVFPQSTVGSILNNDAPLHFNQDLNWTFQNGAFDVQGIFRHQGIWLPIREDTMLQSYTIDERPGRHGLKTLAREYAGAEWYEEDLGAKRVKVWNTIPKPTLHKYNGLDASYTWRIHQHLTTLQETEGTRVNPYQSLLIPAANVFARIQYSGAHISRPKLHRLIASWCDRWLELETLITADATRYGWTKPNFNPGSPKQLAEMLYDVLGLPLTIYGRTTKQDALTLLKHPFLDNLKEFRYVDRTMSTYGTSMDKAIMSDGNVHGTPMLHGTRTGRLSYREPPLQDIPNDFDLAPEGEAFDMRVRSVFVARPGAHRSMLIADYSQIELWQAYLKSGEPMILADLTEPIVIHGKPPAPDYHTRAGSAMYNCSYDDLTPEQRYFGKRVTFGVAYGRGYRAIAQQLCIPERTARTMVERWFARYPLYTQMVKDITHEIQETGEITSLLGRKRHFRLLITQSMLAEAIRQATNFPFQANASDWNLDSLVKLYPLLLEYNSYILFSVHDSIHVDTDDTYLPQIIEVMHRIMTEKKFGTNLSIPVEFKIGKSWSTAKALNPSEVQSHIASAKGS